MYRASCLRQFLAESAAAVLQQPGQGAEPPPGGVCVALSRLAQKLTRAPSLRIPAHCQAGLRRQAGVGFVVEAATEAAIEEGQDKTK